MPQELPRWDNVLLREFSEADIAMVMDLATDPYVPTIGSLPFAASRTDALAYINRQRGRTVEGSAGRFAWRTRRVMLRWEVQVCGLITRTRIG
jgi:ribosomal-protein-alanine N-acetyltransferase